jgi:hypothetical protein
MQHIWVVESSGGKSWRPAGSLQVRGYFKKKVANKVRGFSRKDSPGLKWRVAKYERVK